MASADGSVVIDVQIPVDKVRTDSEQINHILNAIGSNSGDKLDQHFKQNTEKVKANANETSRDIDNKLNKDFKSNYKLDDHDAIDKLRNIKDKIKDIPKDSKTNFQAEDHSSNVLDRIKNRLKGVNQEGKATSHTFRDMFLGSALGNLGSNLFSNAVSGFKRIVSEGMNLNKVTGGIVAQFKAMGLSERQIGALTNQIGFLKTRIGATGSDIATVQKNMMNWSVIGRSGANRLTTALAGVSAAGRLNSQQFAQMSMQMLRVGSTGKVTLGSLSRIAKQVPNFYSMLAKGAGVSEEKLKSMLATGDVTQKQFQTWLAASSKYAGEAFKGYGQTQAGALAQMNGAWQKLEATMTQPLFNMKTSAMQQLATLMTKGAVPEGAKMLGEALRQVAFYGMDILKYIGQHKNDITGIAEDTVKIAGTLAKDVWNDFAGIVLDIGKSIGLINDNGKKSGDALHQLRIAMDNIAKNKNAIRYIADAIIAIAAVKGLGKTVGLLDEIATMKVGKNTVLEMLKGGLNGSKFKGTFQSLKSAGGIKGLSPTGKLAFAASAVFSGVQIYDDFNRAIKDSSVHKKWEDAGSGIGGTLGAGIGAWFGGSAGMLLGKQIGSELGKSAGGAFEKAFNPKTRYNLNVPKRKDKRTVVETTENGYYYRQGKSKHLYYQDDRNPSERELNTGHRLDLTSFLHPQNPVDFVGGILSGGWQLGSHAFDLNYFKRSRAQTNALMKESWLDNFLFGKMGKPRFTDKGDIGKGVRTLIGKWWNGQTSSLKKQFKPLTSAKIDWGWLDPQKNGLNKWLAGFTPQVHGKAPSLKNLQIKRSSILPDLHPIKWIEDQFKGFHWPKLPKFDIKLPEIHPIRWLKSKFKGFHLPHLKLKKPSLKGFNSFIGNLKKNAKNGFSYAKKRAGESVTGILKNIDHLRKKGKSNLDAFSSWIGKNWKNLKKNSAKTWDNIKDTVERNTRNAKKQGAENFEKLQKAISDTGKDIKKGWHNLWNGLASFFENVWKSIKRTASGGINGIVGVINGGISGIDNVIHSFGGKEHAIGLIPKVKLATGTLGNFTPSITKTTLALLNDGSDSPETGNRETIWDTKTGALGVVNGTNVPFLLQPGMEVFSASQSRDLGFTHFAKGTGVGGFLSGIGDWAKGVWNGAVNAGKGLIRWFKEAMNIVSHPSQALDAIFKFKDSGFKGLFTELAPGMFKTAKKGALSWWNQLWSMVGGKLNDGGATANSKLVSEMMKLGEGKPYVWGATGPSAYDCSGLVMAAARKLGVSLPHYSGSQYAATVPVSHPQPGDLVFFGKGGSAHVGGYMGKDTYYSAQSPSAGIGVGKISAVHEGPVSYRRIKGLSQGSSSKVSAKGVSNKRIYQQVGGGFWKFIGKLADLFGDHMSNPAGDGVERWRPAVKRALAMLHLSSSLVNRVLKQMQTESGGNPHAMGGTDGLNDGHAEGLMQVKPGTFAAYKLRGHNNIWNGFDNLLAGLNYAKHKYGSSLYYLGQGHGYRDGGKVYTPQIAAIAEDGAEYVINPNKPSFERLMKDAIHERAQKDPAGMAAKLDHILNFDNLKYSSANGYRYYSASSNGQQADGGAHIVQNVTDGSNQVKGNVNMIIKLDSDVITRKVYPKSKLMQAKEIDIAQMGGAIPVV